MAMLRTRARLRNTASIIAYVVLAQTATAQEADFLGTIQLGESKRDIQTDTATPITVVDQEEIKDRQADTIAELIDSVPGVSLVLFCPIAVPQARLADCLPMLLAISP